MIKVERLLDNEINAVYILWVGDRAFIIISFEVNGESDIVVAEAIDTELIRDIGRK